MFHSNTAKLGANTIGAIGAAGSVEPVLVGKLAVLQEYDPVGVRRDTWVVRDDRHRAPPIIGGPAQQLDDLVARA